MFPGGHFFVDSARKSVLEHVAEDLERSLLGTSPEGGVLAGMLSIDGDDRSP
jgi:hypothetical protein